jgi:protein-L-isoaspartate(D-aspartate) O-methyltransferase
MTIEEVRRFYSEEIRLSAGIRSRAVVDAFARVPREEFLGPGPWRMAQADMASGATYTDTEDADPRHLYHNVSGALDPSRLLMHGQPGTVARWINELDLQTGERVYHLGCGPGYYTAILAEVAGSGGHVIASEVDPELAARAQRHLARYSQVQVCHADGAAFDPGPCDAMLINAGVTLPLRGWLERLREGGRMVLPLTVAMGQTLGKGVVVKITRRGDKFTARPVTYVVIYSCTGARDPELEPLLGMAMGTGKLMKPFVVRCDAHTQEERCMVHGPEVCLSAAVSLVD